MEFADKQLQIVLVDLEYSLTAFKYVGAGTYCKTLSKTI